jgi:hypothetical protein
MAAVVAQGGGAWWRCGALLFEETVPVLAEKARAGAGPARGADFIEGRPRQELVEGRPT